MAYEMDLGFNPASFKGALQEVEFAYNSVPFYKDLLREHSLSPSHFSTPEAFRKLPLTKKKHYRTNFPAGVLAVGKTLSEKFTLKSQSSGTGGHRLTTISYTYDLANRMFGSLSVNPPLGQIVSEFNNKPARFAAPNCSDVECASPFSSLSDRILADGTLVLPVAHDLLTTPKEMIDQAISELYDFKPNWLYVDPTHLAFLVRALKSRSLRAPEISGIALTYTLATGVARRQIRDFFGNRIPMAESVSMTELGWIAMECTHGNMHVNNKDYYVEFIVDGRPARSGELAELVVTSIGDRLLPHLRYATGDIYKVDVRRCSCGSKFPVAHHQGRQESLIAADYDDDIVKPRWVSPRDIDLVIGEEPTIDIYQLTQTCDKNIVLKYIESGYRKLDVVSLRNRLAALFGAHQALSLQAVSYIPAGRSGKFISCLSEYSMENNAYV
ncbi:hypothetical protein BW687_006830 [Pseudomonas graminis]|uniref:phenylacetate--CoA ligase family protein n=1 Tax=Pseudomonas graminis TaxID=158627 RepID=UPI002349E8BF|nr:hypothetical protein [Pseudomonas graminis]MDC6379894.1 hypothetical protein [Pseudomonas graminis]